MFHGRKLVGRLGCALFAASCGVLPAIRAEAQEASPPASAAARPAAPAQTFEIDAYDVDGAHLLDQLTIEKAVYPYLGPDRTVADVEAARAALEKAYRDRGYQSVAVEIVSDQKVSDRVLKLHVLEAPVGRLRVVGARYVEPDVIRKAIPALAEGQAPDFNTAQKQLNDLNRLPDRTIIPLIRPGAVPGTVDIDLKVKDNLPVHGFVELDNDHARDTEPLRLTASVSYSDLLQMGETAQFTYSTAPQRTRDMTLYQGSYTAPIIGTPWTLSLSGYYSNSDVATFGGATVLGKGYTLSGRAIYQLPGGDKFAHSISFGVDFKHLEEFVTVTGSTNHTPLDYLPIDASYAFNYFDSKQSLSLNLSATANIRGVGADAVQFDDNRFNATGDFIHVNLDAAYTRNLGHDINAWVRLSGQLTNQPLVSSEQFSAGGLRSVRGYLQSEGIGDDGVIGQFELRSPSLAPMLKFIPGLGEWRFYGFADAARLWVIRPLPEQQNRFDLYSVGVGTRAELFDHFHGDVTIGWPLIDGAVRDALHPYATFTVKSDF